MPEGSGELFGHTLRSALTPATVKPLWMTVVMMIITIANAI